MKNVSTDMMVRFSSLSALAVRVSLYLIAIILCGSSIMDIRAQAQVPFSVLHQFDSGPSVADGAAPGASLTLGADGNFYGTTQVGGSTATASDPGCGTAFMMTPSGQVTVLHNFGDGSISNDGVYPAATLTLGADGNFYGTTTESADGNAGNVFKMTPGGSITILYEFSDVGSDGNNPSSQLIMDASGNLYGTTIAGGTADAGTVFEISSAGTENILHNFADGSVNNDGTTPATLIKAVDGSFYGVTTYGGTANAGTVYHFTPGGSCMILHDFDDGSLVSDGQQPVSLLQGSDGNFYGTTAYGGGTGTDSGTVFQMSSAGSVSILYSFNQTSDGNISQPLTGLVQCSDANFYGATINAVYCMTPAGALTVLHSFNGSSPCYPVGAPVEAADGSLYGITLNGGASLNLLGGAGMAYKLATGLVHTPAAPVATSTKPTLPSITLPAGLNFFSSPYEFSDAGLGSLFGYADAKTAVWSQSNNTYIVTAQPASNSISLGTGYWARFPQSVTLPTDGALADVTTNFDIPLAAGWTSIGDPFLVDVPVASLLLNNGTQTYAQATTGTVALIDPTLWSYDESTNTYAAASTLVPGTAYWVFASSATDIEVPHP